jgi:hypothetical protein
MTVALREYLSERRKVELISSLSAFVSFAEGQTPIRAVAGTTKFYQRIIRRTL